MYTLVVRYIAFRLLALNKIYLDSHSSNRLYFHSVNLFQHTVFSPTMVCIFLVFASPHHHKHKVFWAGARKQLLFLPRYSLVVTDYCFNDLNLIYVDATYFCCLMVYNTERFLQRKYFCQLRSFEFRLLKETCLFCAVLHKSSA